MSNVKKVALSEVATLQAGVGFPVDLQGRRTGAYPLAKVGDISRGGRSGEAVLFSADHYVDETDLVRLRTKPVPKGSILFAKIGEAISHNHRVIAGCDMLMDNNAMAAIPRPGILSRYLYHFLRTVDFYRLASATTVPALRKSELEKIGVPLPELAEQRRIAEVLDRAETLRANRRVSLAQLDTLTRSIFLDLFGDPARNSKGWPRVPFGKLLAKIDSGWSPNCLDRPVIGNEWGVLKLGAVTWCEYDPSENKALPPNVAPDSELEVKAGDLLFTRKNTYDLVAACALVSATPPRLLMSDLIFRFRLLPDAEIDKSFLHHLLIYPTKRSEMQRLAGGSAGSMPNISKERLQSAPIEVPPLALQRDFASRIISVEKLKTSYRASLEQLGTFFSALQQIAFRGEL